MLSELIAKYKQPYIDEGYALGTTKGMSCIIKDILTDKFGKISDSWDEAITSIGDPDKLRKLSLELYRINTPQDIDVLLRNFR